MQSKRRSLIESISMTALGMSYAVPLNYYMINAMKWSSAWSQAFWMTVWFVVISIALKYYVRRLFNWWDTK